MENTSIKKCLEFLSNHTIAHRFFFFCPLTENFVLGCFTCDEQKHKCHCDMCDKQTHLRLLVLLSTRGALEALWVQKSCASQRCPSCQGHWRARVLCCAAWLLKVWPVWCRWSEMLASLCLCLCCVSTGMRQWS